MTEPEVFLDGNVRLYPGDCRGVLRTLAGNSIDSIVTDPPYHLQSIVKRFGGRNAAPAKEGTDGAFRRVSAGFMGRKWDGGDIAFDAALWADALRVLKPGGYILAFSSSRTYHRMACAIEDAGFITHPMIGWVFGTGFPKAHSVSKHIDRMAGAEREIIGPNSVASATDGKKFNAFGVKTHPDITAPATAAAREWDGWYYGGQSLKPALEPIYMGQKPLDRGLNGTQNILKWGTGGINVNGCRIGTGEDKGEWPITSRRNDDVTYTLAPTKTNTSVGRWPANLVHDGSEEVLAAFPDSESQSGGNRGMSQIWGGVHGEQERNGFDDSGSAARFFYCSKADSDDRLGSRHPTVKPLSLIQWLVRLITPKGGTALDLFAGTGTTAEAAFREGFSSILIEQEGEYLADIRRRMGLVLSSKRERIKPRDHVDAGPLFREDARRG